MAFPSSSIAENPGAAGRVKEVFSQLTSVSSSARYMGIKRQLESKDLVALIYFLISVADIFTSFLKVFQSEEPLIHLPYEQITTLLKVLMGRFIKKNLLAFNYEGCKDSSYSWVW